MTNLANNLRAAVDTCPDRTAFRHDPAAFTYSEFGQASASAAAWLVARGITPGDRIALMLPNGAAFPVLYYAILRVGGIVVPINPLFKSREIEYYLTDSGARLAFVWTEFIAEASRAAAANGAEVVGIDGSFMALFDSTAGADPGVAQRNDDDTAVILYTSGTTGNPKGAELTHGNLRSGAQIFARGLLNLQDDDVLLGTLPLFHVFGQTCVMNAAVIARASVLLIPRFEPLAVLEDIVRHGVTITLGVPTMYIAITATDFDETRLRTLRLCACGGAPLPPEVVRAFEARFHLALVQGYGLSESTACATFSLPGRTRLGSVGHPLEGIDVKIVDATGSELSTDSPGELILRGAAVMKGYWKRPVETGETIRDGWLYTGDVARRDPDGFLYIVDRKKDVIIRGGYNVYPREVEDVLYEHPSVFEAAVVGVPHPVHGEEVVAVVALKADHVATPQELRAFAKERVAPYKYPRAVLVVDALPHGMSGKILKRDITVPSELVG